MTNKYIKKVFETVEKRNKGESEYLQAVKEVLTSLETVIDKNKQFEEANILERIIEPERVIIFRVPWINDKGQVEVNRGFRVQYNSALGPYKGGLRFHPSVNQSILKFLGFEQTFKNALTGISMGGGKGGSDFDPKGKSDNEVMRFCQSFMTELFRHIDSRVDVPAGDIGVSAREIGYLYGQWKRITKEFNGVFTGKGIHYGGSLARKEATGFGLIYFTEAMLKSKNETLEEKKVVVSGSGNVAIYAAKKATEKGAKVVAMSDSNGFIYDEKGLDYKIVSQIKEVERLRISEYAKRVPTAKYTENCSLIWNTICDIALPCATQNELDENAAKTLIKNGCIAVAEGANMPSTEEAVKVFLDSKILYAPGKASNAGGVSTSGLEMAQNFQFEKWSFDTVDKKLNSIMINIYEEIYNTSLQYETPGNLVNGANISGFIKVANAMLSQGVV